MATELLCPKCGGQVDDGKIQGFVHYVSDNAKSLFWSLGPEVRVSRAQVCLACGYVELYLDTTALHHKIE